MQKLIGRSCKETIMEDNHGDRKTLPPSFRKHGMNTYRYHIEMNKKSSPTNINFIIVNKEPVPHQPQPPQPPQPIASTPQQPNTLAITAESTYITPPPDTPATPNTENKFLATNTTITEQTSNPPTARRLIFEPTVPSTPLIQQHIRKKTPHIVRQNRKFLKKQQQRLENKSYSNQQGPSTQPIQQHVRKKNTQLLQPNRKIYRKQ